MTITLADFAQFVNDMQQMAADNINLTTQNSQKDAQIQQLTQQIQQIQQQIVPSWQIKADQVVSAAKGLMALNPKIPYLFGGNGNTGLDCSGLVQKSFKAIDISLPRTSDEQSKAGTQITLDEIRPGDLVSFDRLGNDGKEDHIGISLGGNQMIHIAGNPEGINICDWTTRYANVKYTITRIIPD